MSSVVLSPTEVMWKLMCRRAGLGKSNTPGSGCPLEYTDISQPDYSRNYGYSSNRTSMGDPMLTAADYHARAEALRVLRSPAVANAQWIMSQQLLDPFADAYRTVSRVHEDLYRAVSPLRRVFEQLTEARRQAGEWLSTLLPTPTPKVTGVEESTGSMRRRAIQIETVGFARMRALLARRSQQGENPGRTVTTKPQVTRGPNNTRKSIVPNPLTGLLDV